MEMTMGAAVPGWLTPVAWTWIAMALLSTAVLGVVVVRRRQPRSAMDWVWISSGLYLGPIAVAAYLLTGRDHRDGPRRDGAETADPNPTVATLPGGGASAVAHLIAVPLVAAVGWTIAGMEMWPTIIVIAVLATLLLTVHERAASRARGARPAAPLSLGAAAVVALVTVAAFDIGMVGWMVLLHLNDLMPGAGEATFWFLMQVGVVVGLVTGYPAVRWLLSRRATVAAA